MRSKKQFGVGLILAALLCLLLWPAAVSAQRRQAPPRRPGMGTRRMPPAAERAERERRRAEAEQRRRQGERSLPRPAQQPGALDRRGAAVAPQLWDRIKNLPPEEREKVIVNDERFRRMTPEQQAAILERFRRFNALPPERQQMLLNRQRAWQALTPEQRRKAREDLFPRWKALAPERRRLLTGKLRELRDLSPEERESRLNDSQFTEGLSDSERSILQELVHLGGPGAEQGP